MASSTLRGSFALLGVLVLAGVGCGESHDAEVDGGITFDAMFPDVPPGPDGGPDTGVTGDIGRECSSGADCEGGICLDEASTGFPGGYCSLDCTDGTECPGGSVCTFVDGDLALCLAMCDPASTERTCRAGYGCADSFSLPAPVCIPGCSDDSDCPDGRVCNPDGGFSGEGTCHDADAQPGDACASSEDCPVGGSCFSEGFSGYPGGACIVLGCDVESGGGCDAGQVCLPGRRGLAGCFLGCEDDSDCTREGYRCTENAAYPGRRFCGPGCEDSSVCSEGRVCNPAIGVCDDPFDPTDYGTACSGMRGACNGGTCLTEFDSGFPGSYCAYIGCDAAATPSGCPGDGVCWPTASGVGVCYEACADAGDCTRDGYACLPVDASEPTMSPTACLPACESDGQCANDGFVCNDGTGRCYPAFGVGLLGAACTGAAMCEGGLCVTEATYGWPGGYCAYPGCRLAGTGPAEPCPTGATCIDDGRGDPDLGICVASCMVGSSTCRAGYTCEASGTGTDGTCSPACTADTDCSGGRTCEMATGHCIAPT